MSQADSITENLPQLTGDHLAIASPTSIAETTFSIPAIRALCAAYPTKTVTVLADENTAPLWLKVATVQVIQHSSSDSARKISRLLKEKIDTSIAWEDSASAQAFAKINIPQRIGYPTEKLSKYLTHPIEVVRETGPIEHRINHYLLFVEKLGAQPFSSENFTTPPRPTAPPKPILAIAPGSDFGSAAEWPLERFLEIAKSIPPEKQLAIIPSPDRPGPAKELAKSLGNSAQLITQTGTQLLDYLANCDTLLANDGSIPHLAAFLGTPCIVIFGPNEPEWKRPLGRIHKIIRTQVPCSSCFLHKCPLDHRCMNEIPTSQILPHLNLS